jgi:dihydrofolate reductase
MIAAARRRLDEEAYEGEHMGPIRVHEFISLDGVIDAPTWTFPFGFDPRMGEAIGRATAGSDGILLGRTTYEMFAPAWSKRTVEEDPGAPFFNDTTKYVVSSTLTEPVWQNSELIGGYDTKRIQQLKEESATGLYVSGSATLVHALIADGLVDELHLFVYPVTRSAGPRLFDESLAPATWKRAGGELYDNGVTYLHLVPA